MKRKIINILKEIEKVEDKDKVVFPLLFKLRKLWEEDNQKFKELFMYDKDILKVSEKRRKKGLAVNRFILMKMTNNPEWSKYWKKNA